MDQETRWLTRYNEVKEFIELEHRNPSKYVDAERGLRNWVKQQKKKDECRCAGRSTPNDVQ